MAASPLAQGCPVVRCAAASALGFVPMIISTNVFRCDVCSGCQPDRTCGMAVCLGADIVGSSARANDAGAGYLALDAGMFIPRLEDALLDVLRGARLKSGTIDLLA